MASKNPVLTVSPRTPEGSRATRRLRREGLVPGVLYGGEGDAVAFAVDGRELRNALQASGAVVELTMDGQSTPAVLKDSQRHPVRGETTHVDFVRVDLKVAIQSVVPIELLGADEAPGVREGGVVDQPLREVTVEALPNDIPECLQVDVSALSIGDTLTLEAAVAIEGVTVLDDLDTTVATVLAPRLRAEDEEGGIEEETELVGEGGESGGDAGDSAEESG
jgi:large subunit ribosomal protein L25